MTKTDDGFYELGTENGRLPQLYARSQFSICKEQFLDAENIPDTTISLRSAATQDSVAGGGHGQGFVRCACTKKCETKRCACRRNGLLCNSKCHSSTACTNK